MNAFSYVVLNVIVPYLESVRIPYVYRIFS